MIYQYLVIMVHGNLGKINSDNPNIPPLDVSLMLNTRQNFTSFQRNLPLFMFMSQISIEVILLLSIIRNNYKSFSFSKLSSSKIKAKKIKN